MDGIIIKTALKPNQVHHLEVSTRKRRVVLADKPGKGKSLTALASFAAICNRGVVDIAFCMAPRKAYEEKVWEKECKTHTNIQSISLEKLVELVNNNQSIQKLLKTKGLLIYAKHSHLKSCYPIIQSIFKSGLKIYMIIDEIHAFRNPLSNLTLRLKSVLNMNPMAVIGLSATLLSRGLEDVYHTLSLVKPGVLGSDVQYFIDTFCRTEEEIIGRSSFGLRKITKVVGLKAPQLFDKYVENFLLKGESTHTPKYHFMRYELTKEELTIYRKIADGLSHRQIESDNSSDKDWLRSVVTKDLTNTVLAQIDEHSSRFIYMQYAADGIISTQGDFSHSTSTKLKLLVKTVEEEIINKGQSCLIYVGYYESLTMVREVLELKFGNRVVFAESSGKNVLKDGVITAELVKRKPHIILATKAGTESASYWFMNHVVFFHTPTVPDIASQFVGRITRLNSLFPDDLHAWFIVGSNIDLYKLLLISQKSKQIELVSGLDENLPKGFKSKYSVKELKKRLLWAI